MPWHDVNSFIDVKVGGNLNHSMDITSNEAFCDALLGQAGQSQHPSAHAAALLVAHFALAAVAVGLVASQAMRAAIAAAVVAGLVALFIVCANVVTCLLRMLLWQLYQCVCATSLPLLLGLWPCLLRVLLWRLYQCLCVPHLCCNYWACTAMRL